MEMDPVTQEIIRSGLTAVSEEMKLNLIRTAHSPLIYEVLDFAVGLFDARARTLSQASGLPLFLGNLAAAIIDGLESYGPDGLVPGDVLISNDPYTTGTHLGDFSVYAPIFFDGRLVGFAASMAHLLDIGGKAPGGGWFFDTTDVFQEGIRIRSLKLYRAGDLNQDVVSFLRQNSRFPEIILGDLSAQVAACRTGEKRFGDILSRFGEATFAYVDEIMDQSERLTRARIQEIPDGEYEASAFLDDDGISRGVPVPLKVKVLVAGDTLTVDFSGMPPAARGPINSGRAAAVSIARVALVSLTAPSEQVNEGNFRPLKTVIPRGTIVSADEGAPVAAYGLPLLVLCDLIFRALSEALPEGVAAGHYGAISSIVLYGVHPETGKKYIHIEGIQGGWGGRPHEDGESAMTSLVNGDTRNVPAEVIEARLPMIVEKYALREGSCGPGRFRGGLGYERVHRLLKGEAQVNIFFERSQCPPWGLFEGGPGKTNCCLVRQSEAEESEKEVLKAVGLELAAGARIRLLTGGGGGYGDPLERRPEALERDLRLGYLSRDDLFRDYAAVFDHAGKLDRAATEVERTRKRGSREIETHDR